MSNQQQNVWTARSKQSASRTPQNRSGNASPAQQTNPTQRPAQNVWAQRASQSREGSNGPSGHASAGTASPTPSQSAGGNTFNAAEVKAFLARDAQTAPAPYKLQEAAGAKNTGGAAWAGKREA